MGYQIENYNIDELQRIAIPGAVTPSLFWALPIGNWRSRELQRLWEWFTQGGNQCSDYGLLLIRRGRNPASGGSAISLASVGARLRDVIPEGVEHFVGPSAFNDESHKLLVLSGGYPQPGWGVLIDWHEDVQVFERIIGSLTEKLAGDVDAAGGLPTFKEAAAEFHRWRTLDSASQRPPDFALLEREISAAKKADDLFREEWEALRKCGFTLSRRKHAEAVDALRQATWLALDPESLSSIAESQKELVTACSLLAISADHFATEITPKLDTLIANATARATAFQSSPNEEIKRALRAALYLHECGVFQNGMDMHSWAHLTLTRESPRLEIAISDVRKVIASKLSERRTAKADADREHDSTRHRLWAARQAFHDSIEKATVVQWKLGPSFLLEFEDLCRGQGLHPRTIPWDPARMLGWKLMVRGIKVAVFDLQVATKELSPKAFVDFSAEIERMGTADGSYFTDYIHYIVISKPGVSARTVAKDLVARLLRPAQIADLIRLSGSALPTNADVVGMAEKLLDCFGWRKADEASERTLAACIRPSGVPEFNTEGHASGNELRQIVESFCKDLLDVMVAQLGYSEAQIWNAIEESVPHYKSSSRKRDWNEEVRHISIGAAIILLPALGTLAFPASGDHAKELAATLDTLSKVLNRDSHHQEVKLDSQSGADTISDLIRHLLGNAKALLGELPWHLDISFVYGEQPKIISGEAWSHGSITPRMIRVILWNGCSPNHRVVLWNRTGRNPIMTEPVLIKRPRPGKHSR